MTDIPSNSNPSQDPNEVPSQAALVVRAPDPTDVNAPQNVGIPSFTINWNRSLPWWKLLSSTLLISWRASHLILCALGVLLTELYLQGIGRLFGVAQSPAPEAWGADNWLIGQGQLGRFGINFWGDQTLPSFTFSTVWIRFLSPLTIWINEPTVQGAAYSLALFFGLIAIWGFVGGCIVRRSVVELGTGISAFWKDTFRWTRSRLQAIFWASAMPTCAILFLCIGPYLLGLLSNIPTVGAWGVGLLMVPVALFSLAFGWVAAMSILGFPLSIAAIASERKADAFDGVSRSAAYIYQRPVLLILFGLAFEALSILGGELFGIVLGAGFRLMETAFNLGAVSNLEEGLMIQQWTFHRVPALLMAAFGLSFFWTAQSAMYLILRRSVDSAEYDLIDMGEPTVSPQPSGQLPTEPASA